MMPPGGGAVRGAQVTTLDRIAHEQFVSDEIGTLLEDLAGYEQQLDYDSDDASLIRTTRRDWEKARRVPAELRRGDHRRSGRRTRRLGESARGLRLRPLPPPPRARGRAEARYVECFEGYDEPYDVLLDDYEPGMKTAEVRAVFDELKAELVPLIAEIGSLDGDDAFMEGHGPSTRSTTTRSRIIERFGYDPSFARLDLTVHPFAASSGTQDIRLTTRYKDDDITSIFTAMHECGHGLYEHGVSQRSSAHRSATASRRRCTSRRAGCGRTSSAAAVRSGTTSTRRSRRRSPRQSATSTRSASTGRSTG